MNTPFPNDPREAAKLYLARGWMPIPLDGPRTKRVTRPGWPHERRTEADLERFAGRNIGLLLGEPSAGLVDVDLDCPEAIRAAEILLPATGLIHGRASAPRSHGWYVCHPRPAKSLKFVDPTHPRDAKGTIIELRIGEGNARMTVVPPSTHDETGEAIAWHSFAEPTRISAAELEQAVRQIATVSLFARHWPRGTRHDSLLPLAGGLLRAWANNVKRVERFVTAVCRAARVEKSGLKNCLGVVRDTARKLAANEPVSGWPSLVEFVGESVARTLRDWLQLTDRPTPRDLDPRLEELGQWKPPAALPTMPPVPPFPLGSFPAALADYWQAAAEAIHTPVDYVAVPALPLLGSAVGRSVAVEVKRTWREPPLLWCPVVAPPGSTKSAALKLALGPLPRIARDWARRFAEDFARFEAEQLRYKHDAEAWKKNPQGPPPDKPTAPTFPQLVFDNFTVEALVRANVARPRGVVIAKDELSGLVAALNQYKGGKGDDKQSLLSMWAGASVVVNRVSDQKAGTPPLMLDDSFLGVAGMLVPDTLTTFRGDLARGEFLNDGWADRFLLSFPDPRPMAGETWATVPEELAQEYARILQALLDWPMVPVLNAAGEVVSRRPHFVPFARSAARVWEAFTQEVADRANRLDPFDGYRGVLSKSKQHAVRLAALIYALRRVCGELAEGADLDADTIQRAIGLVGYFEAHGRRCLGIGWLDAPHRIAQRLLAWLGREPQRHSFTRSEAYIRLRDNRDVKTADRLDATFRLLIDLGYLRPLTATGGRPGPIPEAYAVNLLWDRNPRPDRERSRPAGPRPPGPKITKIEPPSDRHPSNSSDFGALGMGEGENRGEPNALEQSQLPSQSNRTATTPSVASEEAVSFDFGHNVEPPPMPAGGPPDPEVFGGGSRVIDSADQLPKVTTALAGVERVGLDLETTGLNPRTGQLRLLQLATPSGTFVIDCFAVDPSPLFSSLGEVELVGHNLQFDLGFLIPLGFAPGKLFDTLLASQVLEAGSDARHTLAALVERHLGEHVNKDEQRSDWSGELTEAQLRYAERDAELPLRLHPILSQKLAEAQLTATAELENRTLPAIAWMSSHGVAFDRGRWETLAVEAETEVTRVAAEMDQLAPTPAGLFGSEPRNWRSQDEVKTAFASVGVTLEATDDETLAEVLHPLAELLRQHRAASKRAGTYGRAWAAKHVAADGRVYPSWGQCFTATGRMSCASPNMQQLPRDLRYRQCFVAPPGRVLVKADYSQIELRIAAALANESAMIAAYQRGDDLHRLTAAAVLNKPVEQVTKADRQLAKAVNFGLLYGGGAAMLVRYARTSYGVTLTESQARAYRTAFFRAYPKLAAWHARQPKAPLDTRTVGGRRRLGVNRFTEKVNTPVQGTGADGLKAALALLWDRRHEYPTAFPVLAVHDEIVIECEASAASTVTNWLIRAMTEAMTPLCHPVPVEVEATTAPTWGGVPESSPSPGDQP